MGMGLRPTKTMSTQEYMAGNPGYTTDEQALIDADNGGLSPEDRSRLQKTYDDLITNDGELTEYGHEALQAIRQSKLDSINDINPDDRIRWCEGLHKVVDVGADVSDCDGAHARLQALNGTPRTSVTHDSPNDEWIVHERIIVGASNDPDIQWELIPSDSN